MNIKKTNFSELDDLKAGEHLQISQEDSGKKFDGEVISVSRVSSSENLFYEVKLKVNCKEILEERFKKEEKFILSAVDKKFNYICRDGEGNLFLFVNSPVKVFDFWASGERLEFTMFNDMFRDIQWSDEKACEFKKYL